MGKEDHLTVRQERFVHEYLVDGNGSAAAIRAGYTPNRAEATASRLLTNGKVSRRLEALRARQLERVDCSADDVLRGLFDLATITMDAFIDDEGYLVGNLKDIPKAARGVIKKVSQKATTNAAGHLVVEVTLEIHDRLKAYQLLGRHVSVRAFVDQVEVQGGSLSGRMEELAAQQALEEAPAEPGLH